VTGSHADQTRSHAGNHSALNLHPPMYGYHVPPPLPNNISGGGVQLVNGPQARHPCLPVLGYHMPTGSFSYAQGPGYQIPAGYAPTHGYQIPTRYAPSASYQIPAGMLQLLHTPRLLDLPPLLPLLQSMDMAQFPSIPWLLVIPQFLDISQLLDTLWLLDILWLLDTPQFQAISKMPLLDLHLTCIVSAQ
jgi:hypothetical protein